MDSLQQSVKITDGMLRALVQRLSNQVGNMGTATGYEQLAAIFGSPATGAAVCVVVRDGDQTLSRLKTKIDALMADFDKIGKLEVPALRSEIQQTNTAMSKVQNSKAVGEDEDAAQPTSLLASHISPADASTTLAGSQGRKRKRQSESVNPNSVEPLPAWNTDQREKLKELAKLHTLTTSVFRRLVPCPDGGLWDADHIFECFQLLFTVKSTREYATRMTEFVDRQQVQTWCGVRGAAVDGANTVSCADKCSTCGHTGCVQLRRAAADGSPLCKYYYVRVVYNTAPSN